MKYIKKFENTNITKYKNPEPIFVKAIENNDIKKVSEILKLNIIKNIDIVNGFNKKIINPLWLAVYNGYTEIVKMLIDYGADVNFTPDYHSPIILIASYHNSIEILALLINAGSNTNIKNEHNDDFFDCLNDHYKKRFISEYPKEYDKYIINKYMKKYNI